MSMMPSADSTGSPQFKHLSCAVIFILLVVMVASTTGPVVAGEELGLLLPLATVAAHLGEVVVVTVLAQVGALAAIVGLKLALLSGQAALACYFTYFRWHRSTQ